jgi:hypothetical protein
VTFTYTWEDVLLDVIVLLLVAGLLMVRLFIWFDQIVAWWRRKWTR